MNQYKLFKIKACDSDHPVKKKVGETVWNIGHISSLNTAYKLLEDYYDRNAGCGCCAEVREV